jgi:acyl-CoA synthetase (AMP-forming)/AMP-acid ligase II
MAAEGFGERPIAGTKNDLLTAEGLRARAQAGAAVLRDRGVTALLYVTVAGPAYQSALFAAACAGVPFVPLNYRLGADQLTDLLGRHRGALVISEKHRIAEGPAADTVQAASLEHLSPAGWEGLIREEMARGVRDEDEVDLSPDAPAVIIYTSGTTSAPKGVILRHRQLASYVLGTVEFMSADEADVSLLSVPPYHIAGVASILSSLYAGRRTILLGQFDAGKWLETVRAEGVTNAFLVPTMLARIVRHEGDRSVPSLRALAYGAAPMPARVIEDALRLWPQVDFANAYGLTETSSTIAILGPEDHRAALESPDPAVRARLGSAGRVIPTIDLQILDPSGTPVPAGAVGRICVRGEQVSGEYDSSGSVIDESGFFGTRDEGYLDGHGFLFIGGRADDTIIRGGENIAPAEIETVLLEDPAVGDAVVIGVPDDEWGQRLEAAVVPLEGASVDPESLRSLVRSRLRGSKTPDRVHVVSSLPRTDTGKLIRRQVAGLFSEPSAPGTTAR